MAQKTAQRDRAFTKPCISKLHAFLQTRTITSFWDAGALLNARFVDRAAYGKLAELSGALKEIGSAPTSPNQLQKCRTLVQVWGRKEAETAEEVHLPWSRAIVLIFIEMLAGKVKCKKAGIVNESRRLLGTYPGKKGDGFAKWIKAVEKLQGRSRAGSSPAAVQKLLGKKIGSILKRLGAVERILTEIEELQRKKGCEQLRADTKQLIVRVEKLKPKRLAAK